MKNFYCHTCGTRVFFVNSVCLNCGDALGFDLETLEMVPLEKPLASGRKYKPCQNYEQHATCNWALPDKSEEALCASCRLTEIIPNLGQPGNIFLWGKIEEAKRRLVFNLDQLGLRPQPRSQSEPDGLLFRFLSDADQAGNETVMTGHNEGIVTLNIAEANDAERERRRTNLGEPYRTLLGHTKSAITIGIDLSAASRTAFALSSEMSATTIPNRSNAITEREPQRTGPTPISAPTPLRTRGKTGRKRGLTTCT